ncbi:hypothetical protein [Duganella sp. P38]|uniref:hypothetical protein n=1 Tax=Duganella sp. P38 TaxID=3423949 RepID=UPI003D7B702B
MSDRMEDLVAAIAARPADGLVGWRAGVAVSNAQFLSRVRDWHVLLRAQAGRNFALYLDDSIEFGAALLGAWHAGKTVWLSADTLEATCASLRAQVDGFLGQFPASLSPLSPSPSQPQPLAAGEARGRLLAPPTLLGPLRMSRRVRRCRPTCRRWWCSPPAAPARRRPFPKAVADRQRSRHAGTAVRPRGRQCRRAGDGVAPAYLRVAVQGAVATDRSARHSRAEHRIP